MARACSLLLGLLAAGVALGAEPGDLERGQELFDSYCASCHGPSGAGKGTVGSWLAPPLRPLETATYRIDADGDGRPGTPEDLRRVLLDGAPAYGGSPLMARFPQLADSPQELADLLAFLAELPRP